MVKRKQRAHLNPTSSSNLSAANWEGCIRRQKEPPGSIRVDVASVSEEFWNEATHIPSRCVQTQHAVPYQSKIPFLSSLASVCPCCLEENESRSRYIKVYCNHRDSWSTTKPKRTPFSSKYTFARAILEKPKLSSADIPISLFRHPRRRKDRHIGK